MSLTERGERPAGRHLGLDIRRPLVTAVLLVLIVIGGLTGHGPGTRAVLRRFRAG